MPQDFRVAETAAFDEKMMTAGNAAVGLWVRAGAWAMHNLTDGFVPTRIARQIGSKAQATRLTDSGLWEQVEGGYLFVNFLEYQRSKEQVESEKTAARQRMKRIRSGERSGEHTSNVQANGSGERSPHVRDSHPVPSLPSSGYEIREGHLPERDPDDPPPSTCPRHPDGTTDPCRACGDARTRRETWETDTRRARLEAERAERLARAELTRAEIAHCDLCDDTGYRSGRVCSHDPDAEDRARRGLALVREQLAGKGTEA